MGHFSTKIIILEKMPCLKMWLLIMKSPMKLTTNLSHHQLNPFRWAKIVRKITFVRKQWLILTTRLCRRMEVYVRMMMEKLILRPAKTISTVFQNQFNMKKLSMNKKKNLNRFILDNKQVNLEVQINIEKQFQTSTCSILISIRRPRDM